MPLALEREGGDLFVFRQDIFRRPLSVVGQRRGFAGGNDIAEPGRIGTVYIQRNPDKLRALALARGIPLPG